MKRRILSALLVLCLCSYSSPAVYAYQEAPSQSEEAGENPAEDSLQLEDVFAEETTDETDSSEDETTDPVEESSQSEDDATEEAADELDSSEDETTDPVEESSEPEEVFTEETTDNMDSSEEESTDLPETLLLSENDFVEESTDELVTYDNTVPTPAEAYNAMIALKDQNQYKEGVTWTNDEPYSDSKGYYHWKGGLINGTNIVAAGCVAFAFTLSDAAFGSLPARMYDAGKFTFEDIKVGDILRVNTDTHTVIVLEVSDTGVVIAEGNYNSKVHWGRAMSKSEVMFDTSHYITRYPEGYVAPDDPTANETIASGTLDGGLAWNLTKVGTLTISGKGAMPDFSSTGDQPWSANSAQIKKVVIEDGITKVGNCAFWNCGVLSAEISPSVTAIGNNAFRGSTIISVSIPSSVKTIGDSAFRECQNLSSVVLSEGLETIVQNAFRACTSLTYITLPASIGEVGAGTFMECTTMRGAEFAPGSKQVKLGDNMFTRCYELMGVTLPASINRIGEGMFQNCGKLPGVEIPQGAESIGGSAFASSGAQVLIIPDSVKSIGTAAFSACPLTDIYYAGTSEQWGSVQKIGDTQAVVSKVTMHYEYTPETEEPGEPGTEEVPSEPESPSESESSTEPESPSESESSTEPESPSESESSTEPESPSESESSTELESPSESESSTEPESPSESESSTEPESPSESESSTEPEEPETGEQPTEPTRPEEPEQPVRPTTPNEPMEESQPDTDSGSNTSNSGTTASQKTQASAVSVVQPSYTTRDNRKVSGWQEVLDAAYMDAQSVASSALSPSDVLPGNYDVHIDISDVTDLVIPQATVVTMQQKNADYNFYYKNIAITITQETLAEWMEELDLKVYIETKKNFGGGFDAFCITKNADRAIPKNSMINILLSADKAGKYAYIYVKNAQGKYELLPAVPISAYGTIMIPADIYKEYIILY